MLRIVAAVLPKRQLGPVARTVLSICGRARKLTHLGLVVVADADQIGAWSSPSTCVRACARARVRVRVYARACRPTREQTHAPTPRCRKRRGKYARIYHREIASHAPVMIA